jgi:hypothetical protein
VATVRRDAYIIHSIPCESSSRVKAAKKNSFIDMFRTPHTEKLHVVERFKVTADNKFLEALVKIEDQDAFNEPVYMTKRWRRDANVWIESICAENNGDFFNANLVPIPQAERPDF